MMIQGSMLTKKESLEAKKRQHTLKHAIQLIRKMWNTEPEGNATEYAK